MIQHGWDKLTHFNEYSAEFLNFMGLGPSVSLALTIFAEFFCAIAVLLGFFTRLAVIPLIITMLVVILEVQWTSPLHEKMVPLFYLLGYCAIFMLGSGRYSLDAMMRLRRPPIVVE